MRCGSRIGGEKRSTDVRCKGSACSKKEEACGCVIGGVSRWGLSKVIVVVSGGDKE